MVGMASNNVPLPSTTWAVFLILCKRRSLLCYHPSGIFFNSFAPDSWIIRPAAAAVKGAALLQRVHRSAAETLYGGRAGRIEDDPGRRKGCYFPLAAWMRSSHKTVKQFSAAFQWMERSHLRITFRSARYITFMAASSLGKARAS